MTISVSISVNGNYKCPVSVKQGDHEEDHMISGRGMDRPNVQSFPFSHGPDAMTITVGPEEPDNGEVDEPKAEA